MSARHFETLASRLKEACADAAWVQWHALGGQVAARAPVSIVDPEALLLVSLALAQDEPRFRDMLGGFVTADTRRISVQRLKRLAGTFPPRVREALGRFARSVADAGDGRWKGLAQGRAMTEGRPAKVVSAAGRLKDTGSLMLRIRAAFGVDVRADVVTYLLGGYGAPVGLSEMKADLGYVTTSLRNACDSLVEAGLVRTGPARPARFGLDSSRWQKFLGLSMTPWHRWASLYALSVELQDWLETHKERVIKPGVDRMLASEWLSSHAREFASIEVATEDKLAFADLVEALAGRLESWA